MSEEQLMKEIIKEQAYKIIELEQQLTELKESQTQKRITRLCNRLDKAEHQNKHLISTIKNILNQTCREDIWKIVEKVLVDIKE